MRSFFLENITRWLVFGLLVGIVSGLGASAFYYLLQAGRHLCFHLLAGYAVPAPAGEQIFEAAGVMQFRPLVFFLLPAIGGLISGLLVYRFAPETEGHGTDAMIDAFHNKKGRIRTRVPFIKGLASIITLSSGGSAGKARSPRSAPVSVRRSHVFKTLSDRERRILLLAGCGGGLSAIFR